ncbi:uncharacterized protein LOC126838433 [Adelges cooleyi]|uniref:uncharacterized protein LOC126838433 n=1 Tax=Adelges cooleyi TaxID=133065 RepID=UPI00217F60B2|nr:uncharacterized protein LOC126838433 [Adelges cooleyi]
MELQNIKYAQKNEELPPISRSNHSSRNTIIQDLKMLSKPIDIIDRIDPLVLVAQYEREINRMKRNHCQMLEDLYKEINILRSKNRDLLDELILMNGGNYCCKHLESLSNTIMKSSTSNNQKQLSDILDSAKIEEHYNTSIIEESNSNKLKKLPDIITFENKCIYTNTEKKSNFSLENQLRHCKKPINVLRKKNPN